ncbi:MAG: two-component regulator propeller domain-containing protein [Bacteroidia bacterium]
MKHQIKALLLRKYNLLICLSLLLSLTGDSQIYNFREYASAGLRQKYIYHISTDKYGQLLLSTSEGLVTYNGVSFSVLSAENGLKDNFVRYHAAGKKGNWIGMFESGLVFQQDQKLKTINSPQLGPIDNIVIDERGGVWVSVSGSGVRYIDSAFNVSVLPDAGTGNINALCLSGNEILAAADNGLYVHSSSASTVKSGFTKIAGLQKTELTKLTVIDSLHICVASLSGDLFILKHEQSGWKLINTIPSLRLGVAENEQAHITAIAVDMFGQMWVSVFGSGVRKIVFENKLNGSYRVNSIRQAQGLVSDYIQSVYCDRESNVWFGSYGNGLCMLSDQRLTSNTFGLSGAASDVLVIAQNNAVIWLGTNQGLFAREADAVSAIPYSSKIGLPAAPVTALIFDNYGDLWIGTETEGVFVLPRNAAKVRRPEGASDELLLTHVYAFCINNKNKVIAGTDHGLYVFDKTSPLLHLTTDQGLVHNVIRSLCCDKDGRIWFASPGSCPYNYWKGEVTLYKDIPGLNTFNFVSVTADAQGQVWYGSDGDGVFAFDGTKFVNYRQSQGLFSDHCTSLVADPESGIWVGHRNAISYLGRKKINGKKYITEISRADLNPNAVLLNKNQQIWFGGSNGTYLLDLTISQAPVVLPVCYLKDIRGDSIFYSSSITELELPFGVRSLRFTFSGILFRNPSAVRYRYMLDGYDQEWRESEYSDPSALYSRLPDGNYTFLLKTTDSEGNWSDVAVKLQITVALPYWKKWWFILSLVILVTLLLLLLLRIRTQRLLRINAKLEEEVAIRTNELESRNEELQQTQYKLVETYQGVTESIRYAQMIQLGTLPRIESDAVIAGDLFKNLFILYLPKDIVSGDFYWFDTTDDRFYIAAVDCTGHGVPGALMSMIGTQLISDAINDKHLKTPSVILSAMDKRLSETLKPIDGRSTDGMDMALLTIDLTTKTALYSGAHRPMWLIRNGELLEYKGSIYSLGGTILEISEKAYSDIEVQLQSGDMIYLFSDGYADQLGGETGRRFMSRRLRELLLSIAHQPPQDQHTSVLHAHQNWRKDESQTDDILFIGLRIP